jgi:hypothetical protein
MTMPLSEQLFHGTDAALKIGDVIRPTNPSDMPRKAPLAWATSSEGYAEDMAARGRSNSPQLSMYGVNYKVEPVDAKEMESTSQKEIYSYGHSSAAKVSKKGFKVTGTAEIVPQYNLGPTNKEEMKKRFGWQ